MKKNIFNFTAFLLIIFSFSLVNFSFAAEDKPKTEKVEKTEKTEKAEKNEKTEKIEKTEKDSTQKQEKAQKKSPPEEEFLANSLANTTATTALRSLLATDSSLTDSDIYVEYGVKGVVERQYRDFLVRVFWTGNSNQAYGLYTFYRDPIASTTDFGTEGDLDVVEGKVMFWQGTHFVQVLNQKQDRSEKTTNTMIGLAQALSEKIAELDKKNMAVQDIDLAKKLPSVVRNLPDGSLNLRTARYILGPKALGILTKQGVSQYDFYPNMATEIAYGEYQKVKLANDNYADGQSSLLIIEYHTPQQSIAAFKRLTDYQNGLPEAEKAKIVLKREGNYIVEATNFSNDKVAKNIVENVKYGYVVKWLDDDNAVGNGRSIASEAAKTAKILVSVFGLIGVTLIFAIIGGCTMGLLIFYFRRRKKVAIEGFSDAGGMVRLDLDGIATPLSLEKEERKNLLGSGE